MSYSTTQTLCSHDGEAAVASISACSKSRVGCAHQPRTISSASAVNAVTASMKRRARGS